jgi:ArsR family transcriptional regulator, arsenate/arsenite/antimonite-responsive transcriptional repressor
MKTISVPIKQRSSKAQSEQRAAVLPGLAEADAVKALAAIAQAQRLRVYRALVQAGHSGLTPGVLAVMLQVSASSLSFHLKELLNAKMVHVEQQGRSLLYRADFAQMKLLMTYLSDNCCAADPIGGCC